MLQVFSFAWEYKFSVILPVAEVPTSGDLKSGNFFRTSTPSPRPNSPMRPPRKFLIYFYPPYPPPPPPPISPSNFAGKTWISLSGSSIGWILIQSHSRLYRSITKKKVSSFCLQRTTCMTQENEARDRITSIRSQMIVEFWNIWSLNLSFSWATDPNFLLSGSFGQPYESGRLALYPGDFRIIRESWHIRCCVVSCESNYYTCSAKNAIFYSIPESSCTYIIQIK